jgi:hypothetical protein
VEGVERPPKDKPIVVRFQPGDCPSDHEDVLEVAIYRDHGYEYFYLPSCEETIDMDEVIAYCDCIPEYD